MLDIIRISDSFFTYFQRNCEVIDQGVRGPLLAAFGRIHISGAWL